MLVGLVAVLFLQKLAEDAEGDRRLQRSAGLGDDVHVKVRVAQLFHGVAEGVHGEGVAHKIDPGISLAGHGLEQLNGAPGAQVGAADAHHHQGLGAAADLLGGGQNPGQLGVLDALGQLQPAGEVGAQAAAACQRLMGDARPGVVGTGGGKERSGAGQINFNHNAS